MAFSFNEHLIYDFKFHKGFIMNVSLLHLFLESKGGINRSRIVNFLNKRPSNIYQISEGLNLNYKTVQHHLRMLKENNVIQCDDAKKYGALYFISEEFDIDLFIKIYDSCLKNCSLDGDFEIREKVLKMCL